MLEDTEKAALEGAKLAEQNAEFVKNLGLDTKEPITKVDPFKYVNLLRSIDADHKEPPTFGLLVRVDKNDEKRKARKIGTDIETVDVPELIQEETQQASKPATTLIDEVPTTIVEDEPAWIVDESHATGIVDASAAPVKASGNLTATSPVLSDYDKAINDAVKEIETDTEDKTKILMDAYIAALAKKASKSEPVPGLTKRTQSEGPTQTEAPTLSTPATQPEAPATVPEAPAQTAAPTLPEVPAAPTEPATPSTKPPMSHLGSDAGKKDLVSQENPSTTSQAPASEPEAPSADNALKTKTGGDAGKPEGDDSSSDESSSDGEYEEVSGPEQKDVFTSSEGKEEKFDAASPKPDTSSPSTQEITPLASTALEVDDDAWRKAIYEADDKAAALRLQAGRPKTGPNSKKEFLIRMTDGGSTMFPMRYPNPTFPPPPPPPSGPAGPSADASSKPDDTASKKKKDEDKKDDDDTKPGCGDQKDKKDDDDDDTNSNGGAGAVSTPAAPQDNADASEALIESGEEPTSAPGLIDASGPAAQGPSGIADLDAMDLDIDPVDTQETEQPSATKPMDVDSTVPAAPQDNDVEMDDGNDDFELDAQQPAQQPQPPAPAENSGDVEMQDDTDEAPEPLVKDEDAEMEDAPASAQSAPPKPPPVPFNAQSAPPKPSTVPFNAPAASRPTSLGQRQGLPNRTPGREALFGREAFEPTLPAEDLDEPALDSTTPSAPASQQPSPKPAVKPETVEESATPLEDNWLRKMGVFKAKGEKRKEEEAAKAAARKAADEAKAGTDPEATVETQIVKRPTRKRGQKRENAQPESSGKWTKLEGLDDFKEDSDRESEAGEKPEPASAAQLATRKMVPSRKSAAFASASNTPTSETFAQPPVPQTLPSLKVAGPAAPRNNKRPEVGEIYEDFKRSETKYVHREDANRQLILSPDIIWNETMRDCYNADVKPSLLGPFFLVKNTVRGKPENMDANGADRE